MPTVEDPDAKAIIEFAMGISANHIDQITNIFNNEKIPIPYGFKDEDVNLNAPRLFSDTYFLRYHEHMARVGMGIYGQILGVSSRKDIRQFYSECFQQTNDLYNRVIDIKLAKGILVRSPMMAYPTKVNFVTQEHFLDGLFGRNRPLLATEIAHVATNIEVCGVVGTFLMGLSQTAAEKDVRAFMLRGQKIAHKQLEIFSSILTTDEISTPSPWDSTIEETTTAPFSDKLMMFITCTLSAVGIGNYGASMAASLRSDLPTTYARLMAELVKYADDGANILISHGWLEQPPQASDRKALQRV